MFSQKNRSRIAILFILISFIQGLIFSGCTGSKTAVSTKTDGVNKLAATIVTDCAGRQVKVPEKVGRIGCLYAFSGHVVTMLGRGSDIVAVVDGLRRDKIMRELVPEIKDAFVPVTSGSINIEELIKAKPDVMFVQSSSVSSAEDKEMLEKSGIPFLVIDYNSIKEQQFAISVIGKAIGETKKAEEYNSYYQAKVDYVSSKVSGIPENKKVKVYHSINEATRTDILNTLPADWMAVAGVINVSLKDNLKLLEGKYYASLEQIFVWDPDAIIANEAGVADYIMKNEQWHSLRAVINRKVYQMPNGISRWGHPGSLETPLALLWTIKTIYPENCKDLNLNEETRSYYKDFFNLDLTNDDIVQILSGNGMRLSKGEKE